MYERLCKPLESKSFFLFGARGVGKSSLLEKIFNKTPQNEIFWIDLLLPEEEENYINSPQRLSEMITQKKPEWVIIDEVQKAPKLLDQVHYEIEKRKIKFALTGSSARKLKRGGANLLAGRAFNNELYPLSSLELSNDFHLNEALRWGTLPEVYKLQSELEKKEYLKSYVQTYLKEEVYQEQLVRNTVPFRKFLPIAAQMNGKILNFNNLAKDLHVDWATVKNYYEILEDTHLGFILPAYSKSLRKQQLKGNRFYFFDIGVQRALKKELNLPIDFNQNIGNLFEHFIVLELMRLNHYFRKDFTFSYISTQGGLEVDLVIERPGEKTVLCEIKSTNSVREDHLKHLLALKKDYPEYKSLCISQEKEARNVSGIEVLPWKLAFDALGFSGK